MDFSGETNNKDCTMNSLPMLVSLIETALEEKTIDKMYGDFLEEAVKMGLSSYTLNVLIINAKKRIENGKTNSNDDIIIPFVYRSDIIKQKPEIKRVIQEKVVYKQPKGYCALIVGAILLFIWSFMIISVKLEEIDSLQQTIDNQNTRISNQTDSLLLSNSLIYSLNQELKNVTKFTSKTGASIRNNDNSDNGWIMWVKASTKCYSTKFRT